MVNFIPDGSRRRGGFANMHRNNRNNGSKYARHRDAQKLEPVGLLKLDELAHRSVLKQKHGAKNSHHIAMDLLRLQHKLNFIVLCEQCHGTHGVDEILAPER